MANPATVLALETSHRTGSVAFFHDGACTEKRLQGERAHASDLLPAIDELRGNAIAKQPIEAVVVGTGPGSYTGLRVGIATALGLVRATDAILRGVPSLEALAFAELEEGTSCVIVLNARAGGFYYARYLRTTNDVDVLEEPCVLTKAELNARLAESDVENARIFGDPTVVEAAELTGELAERVETELVPSAGALLELGRKRIEHHGGQAPEDVQPLYLRGFGGK